MRGWYFYQVRIGTCRAPPRDITCQKVNSMRTTPKPIEVPSLPRPNTVLLPAHFFSSTASQVNYEEAKLAPIGCFIDRTNVIFFKWSCEGEVWRRTRRAVARLWIYLERFRRTEPFTIRRSKSPKQLRCGGRSMPPTCIGFRVVRIELTCQKRNKSQAMVPAEPPMSSGAWSWTS